jgi:hypothetical protein
VTEQLVGVDLREGEYILSVFSKTGKGVWAMDGIPDRLASGVAASELGSAIEDALAQSRSGLPELAPDSKPSQPLLDLLYLPNYAAYVRGTRSVEVYRDGDMIEVTPFRNEGARGGFTPIETEMTTLTLASPEQLAAEVLEAFKKAR